MSGVYFIKKPNDGLLRDSMGRLMSVMALHNDSCMGVDSRIEPNEEIRIKMSFTNDCKCKRYLNWLRKELGQ